MRSLYDILQELEQALAASSAEDVARALAHLETLRQRYHEPNVHHLQAESLNITTPPSGGL